MCITYVFKCFQSLETFAIYKVYAKIYPLVLNAQV